MSALAAVISSNMEVITFPDLKEPAYARLSNCFEIIAKGSNKLTHLEITVAYDEPEGEELDRITSAIGSFRYLQEIHISPHWVTSAMFKTFASLTSLTTLDFGPDLVHSVNWCTAEEEGLSRNISSLFTGQYSGDNFPCLAVMSLYGRCGIIIELIQNSFPTGHSLSQLCLTVPGGYHPRDPLILGQSLSRKFPKLQKLELDLKYFVAEAPVVDFAPLDMMFQGTAICDLSVRPCRLSAGDLDQLIGHWCNLRCLALVGLPFDSFYEEVDFGSLRTQDLSNDGLQLQCLDILAAACPDLKTLTISINAGPTDRLADLRNGFRRLESLTFLNSFLNYNYPGFNHAHVLLYITSLFDTPPSALEFGDPFDSSEMQDEVRGLKYLRDVRGFYKTLSQQLDHAFAVRADTLRRIAASGHSGNLDS